MMPTRPVIHAVAGRTHEKFPMKQLKYKWRRPCWIRAKYPGRCHCGRPIKPGDRALYFPVSKRLSCRSCGLSDALRITADDLDAFLRRR